MCFYVFYSIQQCLMRYTISKDIKYNLNIAREMLKMNSSGALSMVSDDFHRL